MQGLFRKKKIDNIIADAAAGYGDGEQLSLHKVLGVRDLTFFGIAAIIGAGIFSSIGKACYDGGPGVIFLYLFTAIACGFAALCYAEFASTVPVSGSAYTYAYVAFGEIFAWIIGWDLLMEYAIGNIAVAISWSDYFSHLMNSAGLPIPDWLTMDYATAHAEFIKTEVASHYLQQVNALSAHDLNSSIQAISPWVPIPQSDILSGLHSIQQQASTLGISSFFNAEKYNAWMQSPHLSSLHLIMDLPAFAIVVLITAIVFVGIKESRTASNLFVILKLLVIFLVIVLGAYYTHPENWQPFTPNGMSGILKGVSAVFFAYVGFDAISTTAEECKDPQRDLPRAMMYALIICTVLYVALALVLTGMVSYTQLNVGDTLALIFEQRGMPIIAGIVAVSAIIATASVLLVFQMGQTRIWMAMSRDGLLPKIFSRIHPRFKTPSFSTLLTGIVVAVPALFLNLDVVISLTSIGTLFAFVLVCGGIIVIHQLPNPTASRFKVPFISGRYIVPLCYGLSVVLVAWLMPDHFKGLFSQDGLPMLLFWIVTTIVTWFSFRKNFSLLPVFGLVSCFYLMAQESYTNWLRFTLWLLVGLCVYFLYSHKHSRLSAEARTNP
jgi:amino acid transporter